MSDKKVTLLFAIIIAILIILYGVILKDDYDEDHGEGFSLVYLGIAILIATVILDKDNPLNFVKAMATSEVDAIVVGLPAFFCIIWSVSNIDTYIDPTAPRLCAITGILLAILCAAQVEIINEKKEKERINNEHYNREKRIEMEKRRNQWLNTVDMTSLLKELDKHIDHLRVNYSTKNEQIVVGHKTVSEGSIFQHDVKQYATRTRDVPEHQIEKMVLDSYPSDIELEIIRRGTNVLDDLIGKYRSGENLEITKRILKKLTAGEVGKKFEEYEMLEDAENWYASNKLFNDAKRLKEKMRFKVDQTVVHGDYVDDRDTIVKDSVINRSNVGASSDDKVTKLEKIANLKREGLIDDDEFKQMKTEILGK